MAVVIDEMEVSPSQGEATRGGDAPQANAEQQEEPKDHEVERMMQRQVARSERVWAH
jgi:hypothetical protein